MSAALTASPRLGLGLDAGGTETRWALADAEGRLVAQGQVAPLSGAQLATDDGRTALASTLATMAADAHPHGAACGVVAGVTGLGAEHAPALHALLAEAFSLPLSAVGSMSDIELACHSAFAPGQGCVVYAGTGSIAAFIDDAGTLHRAGGRGAVIDDAGGGHWIARQALRLVWRAEDEAPGAWQRSELARALFDALGGSDWAVTRQWVYGATRGELGTLALAVARAAHDGDGAALALMRDAGVELARLARALHGRLGVRPVALAGRVFDLHPAIETALRDALPVDIAVQRLTLHPHHTAARLAAARGNP
jgi:N-acetylglucosamine kinase-like BadF-type ATPase